MELLKIEDFKDFKYLSGIKHSPDGKHACFALHQPDLEENKYLSNLYILELETEKIRKLTTFNEESGFKWQDDEHVVFTALRNKKDKEKSDALEELTELYRINIHGGEADKYISFKKKLGTFEFLKDGNILATVDYNQNAKELLDLEGEARAKELERRKEEQDYEVLEEIPFWANGGGYTSRRRSRLALFNSGGTFLRYLTGPYTDVESLKMDTEKVRGVVVSTTFQDRMALTNEVSLYADGIVTPLELPQMNYGYADFLNDDLLILTAGDMERFGLNQNKKFHTFALESRAFRCISEDLDISLYNSVGTDSRYGASPDKVVDSGFLYFVATEGTSSHAKRIDEEGNIEDLVMDEGSVDGLSVKKDSLLYIGMKDSSLPEIYVHGEPSRRLSDFNTWVYAEKTLSVPEPLSLTLSDGQTIDGFVIKPAGYAEGTKYPAILNIHGGPKTVFGSVFHHEMQVFSALGYFIVFCNPRGSDGKGDAFSDIRGKYGTIDYEDLMAFTDLAMETYPDIDEDRFGVTGGSYGGYMTNWIIGHTDRFRAAASERSIANWISKFNTTDIGYYFVDDQAEGTPWNSQEKLWDQSPLKYADRVKTPTLFIHSDEDYRCWIAEGLQMFTALKYHNVPSRLCMFHGENHELSRSGKPKHRVRRLVELTAWFEAYMKQAPVSPGHETGTSEA
ncbi:MAG TPA: S9 family peptidase [Clostridiaceae bacterium]|nr:S9 family peptidase [Clostridiaceae bacterium]